MDGHRPAIDAYRVHVAQVDDKATVADRATTDIVPTAPYADQESVRSRECHRDDHIGDAASLDDQPWASIDKAVPNATRLIVAVVVGRHDAAIERGLEGYDRFA
jgi:hypothetical protein